MIKIIPPGGWDFDAPAVQLVKVSSRGLRGNDLGELIKRAGYQFADEVRKLDLKPGDVPSHQLIVGAGEYYGSNRNGDIFMEDACRGYHDTFRKHALCFRNHANKLKDGDKSYGFIKHSAFNEAMKRIEILAIYNGNKEAADRNGGEIADEECEKLAAGKDFPISMSCRVPFDYCSACGNEARNRDGYCRGVDEGGKCPAGGLFSKMASVTGDEKFPILCAINKQPTFFDDSMVGRGAERIAFAMGLTKAAAGEKRRGGAELAELLGVTSPDELELTGRSGDLYKLACRMAALEGEVAHAGRERLAFAESSPIDWASADGNLGESLTAMATEKVAATPEDFLRMAGQRPLGFATAAAAMKEHLPGIFGRLIKSGEMARLLEQNPFVPAARPPSPATRRWAEKMASQSLSEVAVERRALLGAIRSDGSLPEVRPAAMIKTAAAACPAAAELANRFAVYLLSAVETMSKEAAERDRLARLVVLRNHL